MIEPRCMAISKCVCVCVCVCVCLFVGEGQLSRVTSERTGEPAHLVRRSALADKQSKRELEA